MTDSWVVNLFADLFQGNLDAFGTEEGGCVRSHTEPTPYVERIERHLRGPGHAMGVYPATQGICRWGCVDFDEGEAVSLAHAKNVRTALEAAGITGWIERSRSKGYHVWVFASHWVSLRTMRRALLAACQLVGAPTKEINPKSEELAEGQLGNYVRLPYPGALGMAAGDERPTRRVVMGANDLVYGLYIDTFVSQASTNRTSPAKLEALASMWVPPVKVVVNREHSDLDPDTEAAEVARKLSGLTFTIWKDGPLPEADRSGTLWKLVNHIADDGLTIEEAQLLVWDADERWGKFLERNDEAALERMLGKVYG